MNKIIEKIRITCNMLHTYSRTCAGNIETAEYVECDYKTDNNPPERGWQPYLPGTVLSGKDKHYWFRLNFRTPEVTDKQRIVLSTSTGQGQGYKVNAQSMVFINGENMQALDRNHTEVRLLPETDYEIYIYLYMGTSGESFAFNMWLSYIDILTEQMYYDLFVPFEACRDVYTVNSYEYAVTVKILEKVCNMLELNYPYAEDYYEKLLSASEYIKTEFYEKICGSFPVTVNCIGHTHIDVAYLWTLAQTREKAQRSFATVIEIMKHYPEYCFMSSQPQLLKFVSEADPDMYGKIKELVKSGRWEPEGAMWLEADCNLTSGESLVRQILHGKRFLKKEFNVDSEVLWLPDVFGYSAALPQILKKSGITHFVTSKISWNDTNTIPYDTFIWQGIDGSEILTDFITSQKFVRNGEFDTYTTYNGNIVPSMVAGTWNRYQQKEYNNEVMLAYGLGDGGGGPTEDMLEQQRRLAYGLPGIPKTKITSLKEHLERSGENFRKTCAELGRTPKWVGELYLEFHRGTYTSMAKNKRYNRKSEMLLQKLESIFSAAYLTAANEYPKSELYEMWDTVLLNQFHDILPGSSIREVYDDSWRQYEDLFCKGGEMLKKGMTAIAEKVKSKKGIFVYNSLGFERSDIIETDGRVYESGIIPAYGWKVIEPSDNDSRVAIHGNTAENDFFIVTIDASGRITRLFDKRFSREVIAENSAANEFQIFEDMPHNYENWEISEYYKAKCRILDSAAEISVVNEGCRRGFKIQHKYHESLITQYVYLYDTIERIDVKNEIEWAEKKQLVKLAFPFNLHVQKTVYDIQFGNVERNNHSNTGWDSAKFEVCGHKWADMSEYDYGVSLINDCKYGFNAEENVLKLTVLKCGTYPNTVADQGHHEFVYSIYPHCGDYRDGGTVRQAYSVNQPLECMLTDGNKDGLLPDEFSFVKTDNRNIIIDTVKQCEDSGDIIIRLFDVFNCSSSVNISFGLPVKSVSICDLMEQPLQEIPVIDDTVNIKVKNFEIVTLRVHI